MTQHSSTRATTHSGFDDGLDDSIRALEPDFVDAYRAMRAAAIRRGALQPWMRELIGLAVHAAVNTLHGPAIGRHLKAALDAGATRTQILETLELTSVLGIHTVTVALPIVLEQFGIEVASEFEGERAALKADFIRRRGSWPSLWDSLLTVDPAFFRTYTDFSSAPWEHGEDGLTPKLREFIYVAVDASTNHLMVPGIRAHVGAAIRYGATLDELLEVLEITSLVGIHSFVEGVRELAPGQDGADGPQARA